MIRRHYESLRASPELRQRISQAEAEASPQGRARARWRRALAVSAAAAALLLVLLGARWLGEGGAIIPGRTDSAAILAEAAANHRAALPADVPAVGLAELQEALPDLPLDLGAGLGPDFPAWGLTMLGGRACKLGGEPAAQINFIDPEGRRVTVLAAALDGPLRGVEAGEFRVEGLEIRLWRDRGRLFSAVREAP